MSGPFGSGSLQFFSGGGGFYPYEPSGSLRFEDGDSAKLTLTPSSTGNKRTFTYSAWVKRGNIGGYQYIITANRGDTTSDGLYFHTDNRFGISFGDAAQGTLITTAVFRDTASWYHIVWEVDTTQATAADRVKLYINGTQITAFDTETYPSQNYDTAFNTSAKEVAISGYFSSGSLYYFDGYMAEIYLVDGTAHDADTFGETKNGVWIPKNAKGSLTFGTNGFYLPFDDSGNIGDDESSNTNDFTASGLASTDVVPDSPTNNFATWNPVGLQYGGTNAPALSEGSLKTATSGNPSHTFSTFAISSADTTPYYWEVEAVSLDTIRSYMGIVGLESNPATVTAASYSYDLKFVLSNTGALYGNSGTGGSTVSYTSWANDDILMFAYKDGKIWIGKNGTWMNSGDPAAGTGDLTAQDGGRPSDRGDVTWYPYVGFNSTFHANFGQDDSFAGTVTPGGYSDANNRGSFKYPVPSGFLSLCTQNLPEPDISPADGEEPADYFNTVLYTGNGYTTTNTQSITGVGFQSDWTWIKNRNGAGSHSIFDVVRGAGKSLRSDLRDAESTQTDSLTSFDSDGFSLGDNSENGAHVNVNNSTYAAWNWLAGGTAVSNDDGSRATSVSANTKAGFSVGTFTAQSSDTATYGHGLNSVPEMMILKSTSATSDWIVYHKDIGNAAYIELNQSFVQQAGVNVWNSTTPTSSVFTLGSDFAAGASWVFQAFHSVVGYSRVGSYTGNALSNGVYVNCGFKPAWVMLKASTGAVQHWWIFDNKREGYNQDNDPLYANLSSAEGTQDVFDLTSNGFKIRTSSASINGSGVRYIFLAFASTPFKYSTGR